MGDCERDELLRDDDFFAVDFRPDELLRDDDFFAAPAEREVGRLLVLFFAAPRADGRRADDFFALLLPALVPRLAPRLAPPRFAVPFFAPPFFAPLRLAPDLLAPPRDDLARVAIVVYPREGCRRAQPQFPRTG
jgi:hypothetical protein